MTPDLADLIEHARTGDPNAARELADIVERAVAKPDRRVGAALMPKKRGGVSEWQAEQLASRNARFRGFAGSGNGACLPPPEHTTALARKAVPDGRLLAEGTSAQQADLRRLTGWGL